MNTLQLNLFPDNQDFSVLSDSEIIYRGLHTHLGLSTVEAKSVMTNGLMAIVLGKPTIDIIKLDRLLLPYPDTLSMSEYILLTYGIKALTFVLKHGYQTMDTFKTKVCFIDFKGEVTAIFPELWNRHYLMCYAHIGQNSSCCLRLLSDYTHLPLDNEDVKHLYQELTTLGYNFEHITVEEAYAIC